MLLAWNRGESDEDDGAAIRLSEAALRGGTSRARAPPGGTPAGRGAPLRHRGRVPTTCSRARSVHTHAVVACTRHSHTKDLLFFRSVGFACRYLWCDDIANRSMDRPCVCVDSQKKTRLCYVVRYVTACIVPCHVTCVMHAAQACRRSNG